MKILVAPNALKGSVSAMEGVERISLGLKRSGLKAVVDLMPIADGGDDTMEVLVAAGGVGYALALGLRIEDGSGRPVPGQGAALRRVRRIDTSGMMPELSEVTVLVACDVDNRLLGPRGASTVFGP